MEYKKYLQLKERFKEEEEIINLSVSREERKKRVKK